MANTPIRITENGNEYIAMLVQSITPAQLEASEQIKNVLPDAFATLSPFLDQMFSAHKTAVPPHMQPPAVSHLCLSFSMSTTDALCRLDPRPT